MAERFPAIFVSHGAPNIVLHDSPARRFLSGLGESLGRPRAVLVASAHWEAPGPVVSASEAPQTIHDFFGFEPELYRMRYPAKGAPEVAQRAQLLLSGAGMSVAVDDVRGIDHGVWTPLMLMYPQADVPVAQVSVQGRLDARHHFRIGEALREMREDGVLILGSGGATHNLREMQPEGSRTPPWVQEFLAWLRSAVQDGKTGDLLDYRRVAPFAAKNHPTQEHFLPLFVALGAGVAGATGRILHSSIQYGVLGMDAYAFD